MNSLLRGFSTLKIAKNVVKPINVQQRALSLGVANEASAGRYHRVEGFSHGGKRPWKNGPGMMKKEFRKNKGSPDTMRIKEFKTKVILH
jgi:hypothetical protein